MWILNSFATSLSKTGLLLQMCYSHSHDIIPDPIPIPISSPKAIPIPFPCTPLHSRPNHALPQQHDFADKMGGIFPPNSPTSYDYPSINIRKGQIGQKDYGAVINKDSQTAILSTLTLAYMKQLNVVRSASVEETVERPTINTKLSTYNTATQQSVSGYGLRITSKSQWGLPCPRIRVW